MAVNSNMINDRDTYQIAYAREFGREEGTGARTGAGTGARTIARQGCRTGAIALRMIGANTPIEFIVSCTGLDKAAVEALARKTK